jgi:hypothetical protein
MPQPHAPEPPTKSRPPIRTRYDCADIAAAPIGTDDEAGGHDALPSHAAAAIGRDAKVAREESVWPTVRRGHPIGWLLLLLAIVGFLALLYIATGAASI